MYMASQMSSMMKNASSMLQPSSKSSSWSVAPFTMMLLCMLIADTSSFLLPKPPPFCAKAPFGFPKKIQRLKCNKPLTKRIFKKKQKRRAFFLKKQKKRKKALVAGGAAIAAAAGPLVAAAAAVTAWNSVETSEIYTPQPLSLAGQSILITGGTAGLGLETAKRLAVGGPANLIVTARTEEKGKAAVSAIYEYLSQKGQTGDNPVIVSYKLLDLDSVFGVQDAVAEWFQDDFPETLDCIVNNAGIMNIPQRELTVDGVERQMASNHLGHFVLTKCLAPRLSQNAKVIQVSSSAHQIAGAKQPFNNDSGGMDFDYCWTGESSNSNYNGWKSYGQSKLANILFSQELQRRSDDAGCEWDVASLHPGGVSTNLFRYSLPGPLSDETNFQQLLDFSTNVQEQLPDFVTDGLDAVATKTGDLGLVKTVEQGASTSVWLASGGYKKNDTNTRTYAQYYDNCKPQSLGDFAKDVNAAQRLWKESEERAGISFDLVLTNNTSDDDTTTNDEIASESSTNTDVEEDTGNGDNEGNDASDDSPTDREDEEEPEED